LSIFFVSLPDAITAYNDEVIVTAQLDALDIWVTGDSLTVVL
jgi:hypothetical protein